MSSFSNPICVALDTADQAQAIKLVSTLKPAIGMVKIGMEFFYRFGTQGYGAVAEIGVPVFLDLKLHDIPNTVAQGLTSLLHLPIRPAIINVHAGAGAPSLQAAANVVAKVDGEAPKLIGLTVLTSLGEEDLPQIGYDAKLNSAGLVRHQARLAKSCGLDGVVCSPHDIAGVKQDCGSDFLTIVPGIRPSSTATQDQKRIATPKAAFDAGADILVIGRAITQDLEPLAAASAICAELGISHAG